MWCCLGAQCPRARRPRSCMCRLAGPALALVMQAPAPPLRRRLPPLWLRRLTGSVQSLTMAPGPSCHRRSSARRRSFRERCGSRPLPHPAIHLPPRERWLQARPPHHRQRAHRAAPPGATDHGAAADGGLIFADDPPADAGSARRPGTDGGHSDGGTATDAGSGPPPLPACAGTLYLRRRFAVSADLARFSLLTLRLRYTDGVVVYLNGGRAGSSPRRLDDSRCDHAGP